MMSAGATRATSRPAPGVRWFRNGEAVSLADVPVAPADELAGLATDLCATGCRLAVLTVLPSPPSRRDGSQELLAAFVHDAGSRLGLVRAALARRGYPALSRELPQAQAFEREILEQWDIRPEGHPWLKPLRAHDGLPPAADAAPPRASAGISEAESTHPAPIAGGAPYPFFRVDGRSVHEVAVGPVHAGIIEPGHFRFQCFGEQVLHLEIQLGYQHRGAEALFLRSSPARRLVVAESIAGDTVIGHVLACCGAWEALAGVEVPLGAQSVRGIALELERLANHVGDLGALCGDIGYLPGAAWFGRLRGEFLNLLLELSGNRFGRGLVRPGGVTVLLSAAERQRFLERLAAAERDLRRLSELVFGNASVAARFEQTGRLSREAAEALGLVGPVARASGCDRDVRRDHPAGIFRFAHVPVALAESGDVMGRALVRSLEAQRSLAFVREQLGEMAQDRGAVELPPLRPASVAVSVVEGWRGEIAHVAVTSTAGELAAYKIVDPSFHNWFGLAMAMRENQISDFPLCNKSFNLSYAGHDL